MTGGRRTAREQFLAWLERWYVGPDDDAPSPEEVAVFAALNKLINDNISDTASALYVPEGK